MQETRKKRYSKITGLDKKMQFNITKAILLNKT